MSFKETANKKETLSPSDWAIPAHCLSKFGHGDNVEFELAVRIYSVHTFPPIFLLVSNISVQKDQKVAPGF